MKFPFASAGAFGLLLRAAVNAQGITSISSQCQTAATSLLTTQFSSCANLVGLVSLATSSGSLIDPLNSWISGVCASTPCSSATLQNASSTINTGCASDISSGSPLAIGAESIINNYSGVRSLLCTQYTSNSTFCLTSLLTNIQSSSGTQLTLSNLISIISGDGVASFISSIPPSAVCNDCGSAVVFKAEALAASATVSASASSGPSASSALASAAASVCGSSFATAVPNDISEAGASTSPSSSSAGSATGTKSSTGTKLSYDVPLAGMAAMTIAMAIGALRIFA